MDCELSNDRETCFGALELLIADLGQDERTKGILKTFAAVTDLYVCGDIYTSTKETSRRVRTT